jgi:uncharacterized membrane protein
MNTFHFGLVVLALLANSAFAWHYNTNVDYHTGDFGKCLCWDTKTGTWCRGGGEWYKQCNDYVRDVAMHSIPFIAMLVIAILALIIYTIYLLVCRCCLRWACKNPARTPCGTKCPRTIALVGFIVVCAAIVPPSTGYQHFDKSIKALSKMVYNNADMIDNVATEVMILDQNVDLSAVKDAAHDTKRISNKIHKDEDNSNNGMGATIVGIVGLSILSGLFGMALVYFRMHRFFQILNVFVIGVMFVCTTAMFIPFNSLYVVSESGCHDFTLVNATASNAIQYYAGCNTNHHLGQLEGIVTVAATKEVNRLCVDANLNSLCNNDFECAYQCSEVSRATPEAQLAQVQSMIYSSRLVNGKCQKDILNQTVVNCSIADCAMLCVDPTLKAKANMTVASYGTYFTTFNTLVPQSKAVGSCQFVADSLPVVQNELCGDLQKGTQVAAASTGLAACGLFLVLMAVLFAPRPGGDDLAYAAIPMTEEQQPIVYGTVIQGDQPNGYGTKTV